MGGKSSRTEALLLHDLERVASDLSSIEGDSPAASSAKTMGGSVHERSRRKAVWGVVNERRKARSVVRWKKSCRMISIGQSFIRTVQERIRSRLSLVQRALHDLRRER